MPAVRQVYTTAPFEETHFRDWDLPWSLLKKLTCAGLDTIGLYVDKDRREFKLSEMYLCEKCGLTTNDIVQLKVFLRKHGYRVGYYSRNQT